jgi:arylsulfatase
VGGVVSDPARAFSLAGEACASVAAPILTNDYPARRPTFTGGAIDRVAVDVSGEPFVDMEREAVAMLARE